MTRRARHATRGADPRDRGTHEAPGRRHQRRRRPPGTEPGVELHVQRHGCARVGTLLPGIRARARPLGRFAGAALLLHVERLGQADPVHSRGRRRLPSVPERVPAPGHDRGRREPRREEAVPVPLPRLDLRPRGSARGRSEGGTLREGRPGVPLAGRATRGRAIRSALDVARPAGDARRRRAARKTSVPSWRRGGSSAASGTAARATTTP